MRFLSLCLLALSCLSTATIWQNDQIRDVNFPNTMIASVSGKSSWKTYPPNATEISYKGRWDSKYISWWSAPGIKFGFTGDKVALSFGNWTSPGVLVAYRFAGQNWQLTNITAGATHQLISAATAGFNLTQTGQTQTFELRVTNYAYGVQLAAVHVAAGAKLIKLPTYSKKLEVIGDSLSSGFTNSYEGISSFGWALGAGFGNVEFDITAYPGICLVDQNCWGNAHGQEYQWFRVSDTSYRSEVIYGDNPPYWDFSRHQQSDMVVINIGQNDNSTHNNVSNADYLNTYIKFVGQVHDKYPKAQIILISLWSGFNQLGNTWQQGGAFIEEIEQVAAHYANAGYVHYFNTTGIMQHNDIVSFSPLTAHMPYDLSADLYKMQAPQYHPTDVGHIKLASHLMQYIHLKFGWVFGATGPEVQHGESFASHCLEALD